MKNFLWIVGIENAHIPDMKVDELAWTHHFERWREDLALAKDAGASAIRYGLPWGNLNPAPGVYDWSLCDEVVNEFERLGLEPIWDLVHFGTPAFLKKSFLDPAYVPTIEAFARAFAARYAGRVNKITPLNEPYITCIFRGRIGIWPPYLKSREGFAKLLYPIVEGLKASINAIRDENPQAEIWLNDGADVFHPTLPSLTQHAWERTVERYAAYDILFGLTQPGQETYEYLKAAGYPLEGLTGEAVPVDVIGLDYYPETEHDVYRARNGRICVRNASRPMGIGQIMRAYFERYGTPLFIAESSHSGDDSEKIDWIDWNMREIEAAQAAGVPVVGYTWWPLFDHIDWNTLLTRKRGFVCPAGLYSLKPDKRQRQATPVVEAFRQRALGIPASAMLPIMAEGMLEPAEPAPLPS